MKPIYYTVYVEKQKNVRRFKDKVEVSSKQHLVREIHYNCDHRKASAFMKLKQRGEVFVWAKVQDGMLYGKTMDVIVLDEFSKEARKSEPPAYLGIGNATKKVKQPIEVEAHSVKRKAKPAAHIPQNQDYAAVINSMMRG